MLRLRDRTRRHLPAVGEEMKGLLMVPPIVGRRMVVALNVSGTDCLITTPVERVLEDREGVFVVETANSVYRIACDTSRRAGVSRAA